MYNRILIINNDLKDKSLLGPKNDNFKTVDFFVSTDQQVKERYKNLDKQYFKIYLLFPDGLYDFHQLLQLFKTCKKYSLTTRFDIQTL